MRGPVAHVVAVLAAILAFTTGCQGGDEASSKPQVTPVKGSVQVKGFSFVPPDDLGKVTDRKKKIHPKARLEMVGKATPPMSPPALNAFVETGDVGNVKVWSKQIVALMNLELEKPKFVTNKNIKVPGASAARLIEVEYTCTGTTGKEQIPCRQVEVLVQMPGKPHYELRYGAATEQYDDAAADRMVRSLRAQP